MTRCGSVTLICLAATCFVIATIAVAVPYWGHFRNRVVQEQGNFGPWTICRDIDYGRKICGQRVVQFRPMFVVYAAGVCSALGVAALGSYGLLAILYMTIQCSPRSTLRRYHISILIAKLLLSVVTVLTFWTAVGLFATQGDDLEQGYIINVGICFYMEVVVAIFTTILMFLTISEYVSGRRDPLDFTDSSNQEIGLKTVISNPAAGGGGAGGPSGPHTNGTGISMTRASGVPYMPSLKYKYNPHPNNNIYVRGGSMRRKSPQSRRSAQRSSLRVPRHHTSRPFAKDLPSPSWASTSPPGSTVNGSTVSDFSSASASTVSTVVSSSAIGARAGPLRSSLKKSRSEGSSLGIPNPGFAGSSPTLSRTSSAKKVRIQSPMDVSTDV